MRSFRFVHAADLHLDSPFKGMASKMPEEVVSVLREATFNVYGNIISLCIDEKVDALLISGDVYDGADRSFKAQHRFTEGLRRLSEAGIRSYICHGNHDPLDGWQSRLDFPEGCFRFGPDAESFPLYQDSPNEVIIHGISYPTREIRENLIPGFKELVKGDFNIGIVHANVGENPDHDPYAPCSVSDLQETGFDYWALGHVHTRSILKDSHPTVVYPGNPQGRHINEKGPRGVYLVDVDESGNITPEFKAIDLVRWDLLEIDAGEMESEQAFLDTLSETFQKSLGAAAGKSVVVRVNLKGPSPIHASLIRDNYVDDVRDELNEQYGYQTPFLWCERISVSTSPPFDRTQRVNGTDLIADLLKLSDEVASDDSAVAELIDSISQIYTQGKVGKHTKAFLPDQEGIVELLYQAENLYLAGLLEEEGQ
mgnify:CR=1 FL=1